MSIRRFAPCLMILLAVAAVGCDSSNKVVEPSYVVDGQWAVQYVETENECGPVSGEAFTGEYLIEESAGTYDVTVSMPHGECEEWSTSRQGNEIVLERVTEREVSGCTYRFVDTTRFDFASDDVVTGLKTQEYSVVAGSCDGLIQEMCDMEFAISGERCVDCWPGCVY